MFAYVYYCSISDELKGMGGVLANKKCRGDALGMSSNVHHPLHLNSSRVIFPTQTAV